MKNRIAKERVIFDNYDWENWSERARKALGNDATEDEIYDRAFHLQRVDWEDEYRHLRGFFEGVDGLFIDGSIGRWNGASTGFNTFKTFAELFQWATMYCDYWKIYDENGHLFLQSSHHDGTNLFEIKILTDEGIKYLDNWSYYYRANDKRSAKDIHEQLYKRYTRIPRYAEMVCGCPKVEYVH